MRSLDCKTGVRLSEQFDVKVRRIDGIINGRVVVDVNVASLAVCNGHSFGVAVGRMNTQCNVLKLN